MYYDHCFRMEMSDHPERNWATTNTQMWSLAMRDPITHRFNAQTSSGGGKRFDWKDNICWKYNRNKCKRGDRCRFEHKCSICGSSQHIYFTCPKRTNRGQGGGNNDRPGHGKNTGNNPPVTSVEVAEQAQ